MENRQKNLSKNPAIYDSMRQTPLFPTVKTAGLYRIPVKSYSKNTHGFSIMKWILVRIDLSVHRYRNFFQGFYEKKYLQHL